MPRSRARCLIASTALVHSLVAMISASQELRAVCSWRMDFQAIGPPERTMRIPERDLNLKSSSGVPSATVLPIWLPQHASLYAVSSWHSVGEGGVASVYASLSW